MTGYDELKEISGQIIYIEGDNTYYVQPIADDLALGTAEKWMNGSSPAFFDIFKFFKNYVFIFIFIVVLIKMFIILLYLTVRIGCYGLFRAVKRQIKDLVIDKNYRPLRDELYEMQYLISNKLKEKTRTKEDRLKRLL